MVKLRTRIFVIAAALLFLLFFSNDFGLIDIQKTAIVAAIGIDAGSEEGKLNVTAQIAVPDASGAGKAGNVTAENTRTVSEAMAQINRKTGWYPTLVHCRLVMLGEATAERDVFEFLNYFLRSEFVEDSCLIAVCKGTAQELFSSQSPIGELTAIAVSKVLSSEAEKTGLVCVTNLREFAKGYFSPAASGYLPLVALRKEAESGGQGGTAQGTAAQAREQGAPAVLAADILPAAASDPAAQSGGDNAADVFDASQTMLFYRGKRAAVLDAGETLAFNLTETSTDFAYGEVTIEQDGAPVTYSLKIRIRKKKVSLDFQDGKPVLTFRVRANAQIADNSRADGIVDIAKTAFVPEPVLRAAEEALRVRLDAVLKTTRESGCDLFGVRQKLHRRHPRYEREYAETVLRDCAIAYDIAFDTLQ